jgi:hypothetical protein
MDPISPTSTDQTSVRSAPETSTLSDGVTAGAAQVFHRDLIVSLAARHKLPAVYYERPRGRLR